MERPDFEEYLYSQLGISKDRNNRDSFTNKKMDMFFGGVFSEGDIVTHCWCGTKLKFANKEKQRCPKCKETYTREDVLNLVAHNKNNGIDVKFV